MEEGHGKPELNTHEECSRGVEPFEEEKSFPFHGLCLRDEIHSGWDSDLSLPHSSHIRVSADVRNRAVPISVLVGVGLYCSPACLPFGLLVQPAGCNAIIAPNGSGFSWWLVGGNGKKKKMQHKLRGLPAPCGQQTFTMSHYE